MTRSLLATFAILAATGCYTDSRGGTDLCVPGHDGLCPAPDIIHRSAPSGVITAGEPVVLAKSFDHITTTSIYVVDDAETTLEEIAVDSGDSHELPFNDQVHDAAISVACTTFCVAVWINDQAYVVTAVRDANGWSTPHVHDGRTSIPMVAIAGDGALVAWMQTNGGYGDLQVRSLDRAGNVLGGTMVVSRVDLYSLSLTAGPSGYLVTWRHSDGQTPPTNTLVAQALGLDGMPVDSAFEAPTEGTYYGTNFRPPPTAFFDGAYHVVNPGYDGNSLWAVIDPTARSIQFAGPAGLNRTIHSITPANPGALVSLGSFNSTTGLVRMENDWPSRRSRCRPLLTSA